MIINKHKMVNFILGMPRIIMSSGLLMLIIKKIWSKRQKMKLIKLKKVQGKHIHEFQTKVFLIIK